MLYGNFMYFESMVQFVLGFNDHDVCTVIPQFYTTAVGMISCAL